MKALGRAMIIGLVFLLPLTMYLGIRDSFDLPKMVLVYLAATVLLCIWLIRGIVSGQFVWKTSPLDVPLLVYLIVLGLATIFSSNPRLSLWGQYREYAFGFLPTVAFASLFWMTVQFCSKSEGKFISALAQAAAISGGIVALYAIAQYMGYEFFSRMPKAEGTRIWATLGNPIYLGAFLAMVIPVVLGEWLFTLTPTLSPQGRGSRRDIDPQGRGSKGNYLFLFPVTLLIMTLALMLTLSRSAWVGLAVAMVIFAIWSLTAPDGFGKLTTGKSGNCDIERPRRLMNQATTMQPRHNMLLGAFVLTTFLTAVFAIHQPARQRFASIFNPSESSNAARIAGWKAAWEIFREHPVLGAGPDTFKETFRAKRSLAYVRATGPYTTQNHVHNDLLQIAATSGVLGLGAYLWICVTIFLIGFKSKGKGSKDASPLPMGEGRVRGKGKKAVNSAAGWFCGLAALFVQNQFNFSTVTTSALAAVFCGVLCATHPHPHPLPSREREQKRHPLPLGERENSEGNHHSSREREIIFSPSPLGGEGRVRGIAGALLTLVAIVLLGATGVLCWRFLHADVAYKDGLALVSAKNYRQAVSRLEDAVRFNPNVVDYRLALANSYRDMATEISEPEMRLPFLKKALSQAQEIVRLEPHNPDSHTNLGVAFMWLTQLGGEDHRQEAWEAFRRTVEIDQFSVETWAHLARTAHFLGDVEKEKQLWQKVLEIDAKHSTAKQMVGEKS